MIETENYILFWKDKLSNFAKSEFIEGDMKFNCVEQYFMYNKALYFGDKETAEKIMKTDKPWEAKRLGRLVRNYDDEMWSKVREKIMYEGNLFKYRQNKEFRNLLLNPR